MSDQAELDAIILQLLGREEYLEKRTRAVVIYNSSGDIVKLDLSSLALKSLPDGLFDNFTELRELDLSQNSFERIPDDMFVALGNLRVLNLSATLNPIDFTLDESVSLPENLLKNQKELLTLNLSGNQLELLPDAFFSNLYNLETLDLRYNLLAHLPPSIGNLINLDHLYLESNFLPVEFSIEYLGYHDVQEFLTPFHRAWMAIHASPLLEPTEEKVSQTDEELRKAFSMLEDLFD